MSFPKESKFFPARDRYDGHGKRPDRTHCAAEIAAALHRSFGLTRAGVKTVAGWTGANERTVKNWFSGRYAPSGEHLLVLIRHSDEVLVSLLVMAGRRDLTIAIELSAAERLIADVLEAVRSLIGASG